MSIGRPVSGEAAVVGGAGMVAGRFGATGGVATVEGGVAFGFVVTVVEVATRVVVVVGFGFGRVVVVVEDDVVVGAGLMVSTFNRSVPQALPATSRTATRTLLKRAMGVTDRSGTTSETGGYFPTRLPRP
jgi:hypothetical protein